MKPKKFEQLLEDNHIEKDDGGQRYYGDYHVKIIAEAYHKAEAIKLLNKLKHPTNTKLFNRRIEREIKHLEQ
jgi:hypothetical protein